MICVLIFERKTEVTTIRITVRLTNGYTKDYWMVVDTATRTRSVFLSMIDRGRMTANL